MAVTDETALGLLETQGLLAAVEGADAMLKTAEVRLLSVERTDPALITVLVVGEVAAVQASVDAGKAAAQRVGKVLSAHVIPRPDEDVRVLLRIDPRTKGAQADPIPGEDLENMTVRDLRAIARDIPDFPIQGREVARARKGVLIKHLHALRRKRG